MNSNLCFNSSKEEQYDCHYYSFIIFIRVGSAMFRIPEMVNNSPSVSHIFHQFLQQKLLQFQETPSVLLNMFCFLKLYTFVHDVKKWQFFFLFTRNILLFLSPVYFYRTSRDSRPLNNHDFLLLHAVRYAIYLLN